MRKSDPYYCLACNGPCGYGKPVRPTTKKGRTRMKKSIVTTAILLLLPTVALATGLPAPLQADYDIGVICEDARWSLFRYDGFSEPWIGATGFCQSLGKVWKVEWACNPVTGDRGVQRVGRDVDANGRPVFRRVDDLSVVLTDRELCK